MIKVFNETAAQAKAVEVARATEEMMNVQLSKRFSKKSLTDPEGKVKFDPRTSITEWLISKGYGELLDDTEISYLDVAKRLSFAAEFAKNNAVKVAKILNATIGEKEESFSTPVLILKNGETVKFSDLNKLGLEENVKTLIMPIWQKWMDLTVPSVARASMAFSDTGKSLCEKALFASTKEVNELIRNNRSEFLRSYGAEVGRNRSYLFSYFSSRDKEEIDKAFAMMDETQKENHILCVALSRVYNSITGGIDPVFWGYEDGLPISVGNKALSEYVSIVKDEFENSSWSIDYRIRFFAYLIEEGIIDALSVAEIVGLMDQLIEAGFNVSDAKAIAETEIEAIVKMAKLNTFMCKLNPFSTKVKIDGKMMSIAHAFYYEKCVCDLDRIAAEKASTSFGYAKACASNSDFDDEDIDLLIGIIRKIDLKDSIKENVMLLPDGDLVFTQFPNWRLGKNAINMTDDVLGMTYDKSGNIDGLNLWGKAISILRDELRSENGEEINNDDFAVDDSYTEITAEDLIDLF